MIQSYRWLALWILLLTWIMPPGVVPANEAATSPTLRVQRPLLRIGYLRREETGHPAERYLEGLREALLADPLVTRELTAGGYAGIGLFSCDGAADMVRRLNAREFDVAFTPANLYMEQAAGYTAVLKARRPRDIIAPPPSDYVRRLGVVFVSARSPLFGQREISRDDIRNLLRSERLAVVSTQSVAGFNAPLLSLARRYDVRLSETGYAWFESSEEVVKAVLSGLASVGACEAGALDSVLVDAGLVPAGLSPAAFTTERDRWVRVLVETEPVITDPVVLRRTMHPRLSTLGRAIRLRIRDYSLEGRLGDIQYRETTDDEYRSLRELLDEFNRVVGEVPR
jgi:ABC-type phosphate/phosphonate transport system substrate-binding protein